MACLDEAIKTKEKMLEMFKYLSEQNDDHIVTNEMISSYGGKYMLYYSRYISQLNMEDECITIFKVGKDSWQVYVNYTNIRERGVYSKLLKMRAAFDAEPNLNYLPTEIIERMFHISHKTFIMFKGYYTFASDKKHKE